ncbi:hypothetical protein K458DRAFT_444963 [Lentithecium fluviatile CBS 122367]|uniref:DUF6536 domain-containing protein n=1 Tax=Lentithecium fluviatile CBS 122367 TaxID=1168545 RepID=A0A6G1IT74_9PLEO|nr:hypothetical protein K458DRAFT_444963 [Lentithecium fluviatile CBS 122367]
MAGTYNYDRLPAIEETQDIAEYIDTAWHTPESENAQNSSAMLRNPSSDSASPNYSTVQRNETADHASLNSSNSYNSSSNSIDKTKNGWEKDVNRIRRKPLPRYMQSSVRNHPAADIEPTRIGRGVWKDQFLVDRSLRGMALLTTLFAIAMLTVVCVYAKAFGARANKFSSSIGGQTMNCNDVTHTNTVLLLAINVAATMLLGMSNTYQQLVTSLKVGDLKHMLEKFGDSRVGTNSPFNINHKQSGKKKSWAAWLLLVVTSLPIHFLANSLIGPSYIFEPPQTVEYQEVGYNETSSSSNSYYSNQAPIYSNSFICWSAFKSGRAHIAEAKILLLQDSEDALGSPVSGSSYTKIIVRYARENCSGLANTTTDVRALEFDALSANNVTASGYIRFQEGGCTVDGSVKCTLSDPVPAKCRLNVRLNAAFVLTVALIIKAVYMVTVNIVARGHFKRSLLTFGDVIVASASNPELRIQGECMVNAGETYRRRNTHTCHKHCKNPDESKTGDEIAHCQKCKKYNDTNRFHNESQPTISTKIKRTLISNLGNTALTQMCIMLFCCIVLMAGSLAVAVPLGMSMSSINEQCDFEASYGYYYDSSCKMSKAQRVAMQSGGWGGFNSSIRVAELPPDELKNEFISFCISNGAQFIYSLLYLLLIYNITLVSQEKDWGTLEHRRKRLRCTIVKGPSFKEDYLLQLPKKILFPVMTYSIVTHWMLGEALQTQEAVWMDNSPEINRHVEHSKYMITYAAYPLWVATGLILLMTTLCWWAFTYRREGFIPQMFGSIRTLCSATSQLDDFPENGIMWGDLGMGKLYRHAGLSPEEVMKIVPYELYAGMCGDEEENVVRRVSGHGMEGENLPLLWRGKGSDAGTGIREEED